MDNAGYYIIHARWFYENFSVDLLHGSAALTHCARRPRPVSEKFLEEEILAGTNFRELAFDRENRENFCFAKISRYTVFAAYAIALEIPAATVASTSQTKVP